MAARQSASLSQPLRQGLKTCFLRSKVINHSLICASLASIACGSIRQQHLSYVFQSELLHQRRYTTPKNVPTASYTVLGYNDIQKKIQSSGSEYCLLDVREENEMKNGHIPTARNVPLSQFATAWVLPKEDFKQKYGFSKPEKKDELLVYCLAGVRSTRAAEHLMALGYKNIGNYVGSWADYVEQRKKEDGKTMRKEHQ